MRIAIIGGGASGLMSAIKASINNEVTIYEKNNKCGKKILVTGNGKCNYFNEDFNINKYNSSNKEILSNVINKNTYNKVLEIFDEIGIVPKIQNGYFYPVSGQAVTIQEHLIKEAKLRGVKFELETEVLDIEYNNEFILKTNKGIYKADKVILSSGSKASPKTGSNGMGYTLAKKFGHSIIEPLPALVQLIAQSKYLKDWAGVRMDANISLYENDIKIDESFGEIQLTNYGVSGICIFQLSSKIVRGLYNNKKEYITINFLPWLNEDINLFLKNRNLKMKNRTISELLDGLLNYKLVNLILKKNNILNEKKYNELTNSEIDNICSDLTNFKLNIIGSNDFDSSQVASGGVPLNEININTFESLKQKGLYIIGELLDVDGLCGGYNLGFAWISAILCGEGLVNNI